MIQGKIIDLFRGRITKLFTLVLAIYLFNFSIDFTDVGRPHREDLSVNKIESIAELVVEEIADVDNFFDEQNESEKETPIKGSLQLIYVVSPRLEFDATALSSELKFHTILFHNILDLPLQIPLPPPRIA